MTIISVRSISAVALFIAVSGCSMKPQSDYGKVELLTVTGTVTLDGEPLPEAVVTFEDTEFGAFSYGMTDAAGFYRLQFDSNKSGCTPGTKRVEVSTTRKILGLNTEEEGAAPEGEEGGDGGPSKASSSERVPAKYNKESELIVEVTADKSDYPLELSSK